MAAMREGYRDRDFPGAGLRGCAREMGSAPVSHAVRPHHPRLRRSSLGLSRRLALVCTLALAVTLALSALGAANASASAPDFGVCKREMPATHVYKNPACTKVSSGSNTGEYEWYSGAEGGSSVEGTTKVVIQIEPSNDQIECTGSVGEDQYKGPTTLGLVLIFSGCKYGGNPCQATGYNRETIVTEGWLEGELQVFNSFSNPIKNEVALVFEQPSGGPFFTPVTCGTTTFKTKGELMVPVETNLMQLTTSLYFQQTGGVQYPNDSGFYTLRTSVNSGPYEETGIEFKVNDTADQDYEVNTVA